MMTEEFDKFHCKFCHADLSYEVDGKKYSKLIGVEIRGEYDGVSYWHCPVCTVYWSRFTGDKCDFTEMTKP